MDKDQTQEPQDLSGPIDVIYIHRGSRRKFTIPKMSTEGVARAYKRR